MNEAPIPCSYNSFLRNDWQTAFHFVKNEEKSVAGEGTGSVIT